MISILFLTVLFIPGTLQNGCPGKIILFITTPKTLEGLSGSCLHIPCSFRAEKSKSVEFDDKKKVFGVWIKNDQWKLENTVFNSSKSVNIYPMNIPGDLKKKDCTTLFSDLHQIYTDSYYFRVENDPYKATAACDSLHITVRDSAWSPSINVSGDLKDLKEEESVSISCSARTPCPLSPPELTWSLQQVSQRQTETNPDGTVTTKIQEIMTLSDTHDGSNITCSVRYPVDGGKRNKTAETNLTLSVSYAPKDTSASISPSGLVSAGSWVELSCSSRAKPPVRTFTWFKNCTGGPVKVSEGQVYRFNFTEGGEFYCVAANNLGVQMSPVVRLSLEVEGSSGKPLPWVPIIGGIIGIILLIVIILTIARLRRAKKRTPSVQQLQNQTSKEERLQRSTKEKEEEEIHYGEFKFSNQASYPPSTSTPEQETVYAQVNVSAKPSTKTAEGPEDLYAQVRKI